MTNTIDDPAQKIKKNYDIFLKLCGSLGDRSAGVLKFVEYFGTRLAMCPASSKTQYHNAFPGGLIDHSLRVLANAHKIAQLYSDDIPKDSLILSALFHDIGKVGDLENDYYLHQDSNWHRERGMMYKHNDKLVYMTSADRGLFLLQHFDVKLTEDEWLSN